MQRDRSTVSSPHRGNDAGENAPEAETPQDIARPADERERHSFDVIE